jgi:hypothetical protein
MIEKNGPMTVAHHYTDWARSKKKEKEQETTSFIFFSISILSHPIDIHVYVLYSSRKMAKILIVLMIVILGVSGDGKSVNKRDILVTTDWNVFVDWLCQHDLASIWGIICTSSTTASTTTTTVPTAS